MAHTVQFLVAFDDENGENLDLVVEAFNVDEAIDIWRKYYERDLGDELPDSAFEIPTPSGFPHAVAWNDDNGMKRVARTKS